MKIAVDEHIPLMTVRALRDMGHDVRDIRGTADEGMPDDALWEMTQREGRLLITTDKGFTHYRTAQHYGILIIRLHKPNRHRIHHASCTRWPNSQKRNGRGCWWSCAT